jgi:hypothetical protein
MRNLLWKAVAFVVSREPVAEYLIKRSQRTPYQDIPGYMERWWLFNAYDAETYARHRMSWLPSIRVHHILRADTARHLHDHPWNARTIILKGWYRERRLEQDGTISEEFRTRGQTQRILYGQYHSIDEVSDGGVYTLFFTWKYCGNWGFLVDGKKVNWRDYDNA